MKKNLVKLIPATVVGISILVFVILIGGKVYAQSVEAAEREQRELMESRYISVLKEELTDRGYANSGVNMTKQTDENGEWEYTVTVYHRSFAWMNNNKQQELENMLEDMGTNSLGKISLNLLASYQ